MVMQIATIGLDISKHVFQIHAVDDAGHVAMTKRLRRSELLRFFGQLDPCLVGIEACGTSHYWARELTALGHDVKLMPPTYVKAYTRGNKNDASDAEAIWEAVTRPTMRFVPIKGVEQQAVLVMHREACEGCSRGACQQDCSYRLGADGEQRGLSIQAAKSGMTQTREGTDQLRGR
jgi:transposase